MTVLFMGGEMGAFVPADNNTVEVTTASTFDSAFSRCGMSMTGSATYSESASFTASDTLYVHFAGRKGSGTSSVSASNIMELLNASGTPLFRVVWVGTSDTVHMEYWNGAAFVTAGSAFSIDLSFGSVTHFDLYVNGNGAANECSLYVSGTLRATATVNLSSVASITKVRSHCNGVTAFVISQVIVADAATPTIGMRLATYYPSGAGATSAWTYGTYANIDEIVTSDADIIYSDTANQISTFAHTGPTLTDYNVVAVGVSARAKRGPGGPQKLRLVLRSGGTNYASGSDITLGVGYTANVAIWETDPATSLAWVNTAISSIQPGVKSIT